MYTKRTSIFAAISALLLTVLACGYPANPPKATPAGSSALALAATQTALAAQVSPQASPSLEPPSETPNTLPTETPTETPLPVGVLPTETPTATLVPVLAEVMKETNCRSGPSGAYDLIATFPIGTKLEVTANDLGGGFIVVKNPGQPETECYILANNVKISGGEVDLLPEYTPLPSPTAAPNINVQFKKFDTCKGDVLVQFVVQNTGSVPFRSAYLKVTNTKTGQAAEQAVNAFDLVTGCIIARNIAPLDPGATGYLSTPVFKNDPRGNTLKAVIQACTEKGLKGTCVLVSLLIKP